MAKTPRGTVSRNGTTSSDSSATRCRCVSRMRFSNASRSFSPAANGGSTINSPGTSGAPAVWMGTPTFERNGLRTWPMAVSVSAVASLIGVGSAAAGPA